MIGRFFNPNQGICSKNAFRGKLIGGKSQECRRTWKKVGAIEWRRWGAEEGKVEQRDGDIDAGSKHKVNP